MFMRKIGTIVQDFDSPIIKRVLIKFYDIKYKNYDIFEEGGEGII